MSALDQIRSSMTEKGLSAMLLTDMKSIQWATGFSGSYAQMIVTPESGVFITDSRYTIQAAEQVHGIPIVSTVSTMNSHQFLKSKADNLNVAKMGFESDSVTYNQFSELKAGLDPIDLVPVSGFTAPLRAVKTETEIAIIRRACALADKCMEHVVRLVQPGVTEYEINLEVEFYFRRHGAELAFEPIVVSGENSARPHGRATEKKLAPGDFVTMDFGCKIDGYCSDITRTFVVSEATERHERIYNAVLKSQLAALDAIRANMNGKDVDKVARDVLAEEGLAEYFGHGLGHGLGRLVHDPGSMSPRADFTLKTGMVMTVEPGVYIEGFGGVRIEDDVVVLDDGIEILTHFPKNLMVLP